MIKALNPLDINDPFPEVSRALVSPNGLLAIGGCLSWQRLVQAYKVGIFPWFSPGEPILWWSPDPRTILLPDELKVSRSLRKVMRKTDWRFSWDNAFLEVLHACAAPRADAVGTWLTETMIAAYAEMHTHGFAHSFEVWADKTLIGGLYGVTLGRVFFGESMFHRTTDASKVAFVSAVELLRLWDYELIDCQVHTNHLVSLGARSISRSTFADRLKILTGLAPSKSAWHSNLPRKQGTQPIGSDSESV